MAIQQRHLDSRAQLGGHLFAKAVASHQARPTIANAVLKMWAHEKYSEAVRASQNNARKFSELAIRKFSEQLAAQPGR